MTDLLNRPEDTRSTRPAPGRPFARWFGGPSVDGEEPVARPLVVSAALASLAAIATAMGAAMVVSVIGWFLADAGAHGETTDALGVGAVVWLVGHGSRVTLSGAPLGIVPLALTLLIALVVYRWARWAGRTSAPVEDDRAVALAATVFSGIYLVVAVVTCVLVGQDAASPGMGRAMVGSLVVSGVAGTLGLGAGTGRLSGWVERVPGWIRSIAYGASAAFLLLVAASAVLVAVMLVLGLNDASTMMSALHLSRGDYVTYALATVSVVPNAVLLGSAYLLGPGFAVGTGTIVSPSAVALGPVPAFPLLAALPDGGPTPQWVLGLLAVPVLVGAVGAVLAQRAYGVTAYDSAALRGFGSGFAAAILTTLAIALAGGPMGTGRMADVGASFGEVLVSSVAAMSLGGLVAGVATAWWQRRGAARPAPADD